jgi:hypothetical protein
MLESVKQENSEGKKTVKRRKLKREHTLTIMMTPEERKELERLSRREGLGAGAFVRMILRKLARELKAA